MYVLYSQDEDSDVTVHAVASTQDPLIDWVESYCEEYGLGEFPGFIITGPGVLDADFADTMWYIDSVDVLGS